MKIVNIEMINDTPVYTWRKSTYYPLMVTYKPLFSKKLKHKRYNPTGSILGTSDEDCVLIYADKLGNYCDYDKNMRFKLFMEQIQTNIEKSFGPGSPKCYTEGNRHFGCTADIERKGWINGTY